jgi:phytoene desaturase
MKKIAIVGAGPGGLAAGLMLSANGFEVDIYEKDNVVGGRSKRLSIGDYFFDAGPTFLMYLDILEKVFQTSGYDLSKELNIIQLDPLYELDFIDFNIKPSKDPKITAQLFEDKKKGSKEVYFKWLKLQEKKLNLIAPILEKPFPSIRRFFDWEVIKGVPVLHPFQSVYSYLYKQFKDETLVHALSFQAKYLGMASYQAPSVFTILPYLEHAKGLFHVEGGLNQINEVMAKLITKNKSRVHLNSPVKEVIVKNKKAIGLKLADDEIVHADYIVLNADFAYAMSQLFNQDVLNKYTKEKMEKKKYSVSTFMIYLGLKTELPLEHHTIIFSKDYGTYLKEMTKNEKIIDDISIYVHNPSRIDKTLAKEGMSALYILVPVPNTQSNINYEEIKNTLKDKVYDMISKKINIDFKKYIEVEKIITPTDWKNDFNVFNGAVFNLSHNYGQMLHKRPKNKFDEVPNIYLVGGGTHPGSGLPTIYQSALIAYQYLNKMRDER